MLGPRKHNLYIFAKGFYKPVYSVNMPGNFNLFVELHCWCRGNLEHCGVGWVKLSKLKEVVENILRTVCLVLCIFAFLQGIKLSFVIWRLWRGLDPFYNWWRHQIVPFFTWPTCSWAKNFHSSETGLLAQWTQIRCQLYPISNIGPEGCSSGCPGDYLGIESALV